MNPFDTSNKTMFSPLWESVAPRFVRRGHFWVTGERIKRDGLSYQAGPMYVAWEAPAEVTRPYPKGRSPTSTGERHSRERSWHDLRNNSDDVLKVVLDWLIRLEGLQYRRH